MTMTGTLDCTDIKALLSGLVDDEVDRETRHAAERHMAGCAACRGLVSDAERMDAAIALEADLALKGGELPADFEARVLAATAADRWAASRRAWVNWTGWLAAAAALALAMTMWVMQLNRGGSGLGTSSPLAKGPVSPSTPGRDAGARLAVFHPTFGFPPDQYESVVFSPGTLGGTSTTQSGGEGFESSSAGAFAALVETDPLVLDATFNVLAIVMESSDAADDAWQRDAMFAGRVVNYDELLPRLEMAQREVSAVDKPTLFAARSALASVAEGIESFDELKELQGIIRQLEIMRNLRRMSESSVPAAAL
jgi:hypothetical protein